MIFYIVVYFPQQPACASGKVLNEWLFECLNELHRPPLKKTLVEEKGPTWFFLQNVLIPVLEESIVKAYKAVKEIIARGFESAMNKYNGK